MLSVAPVCACAQDLCAPSEATDPQPLHINGSTPFVYKSVGGVDLRLHVFRSAANKPGDRKPALVFFTGGGFFFGDIRRYQTQATHLALKGLVTVLVDYRVKCRNGSTIMDSVSDGKSAMRWVRAHADELGVDPSRIAAVGSSAGALMAAAAAVVPDFDDPADPKVDARPNALVLYNPALSMTSPTVVNNLTRNWGSAVAAHARDFSPIDHLDSRLPPTIIFQGTADKGVSPETVQAFCRRARTLKSRCEVVLYPGAPHGFSEVWLGLQDPVNFPRTEFWAEDTSRRTDRFLASLGWLPSH
ncbi:MAG: alpha/beta hydrolase [Proteobacteria bacterium]|nr:alpha/beta hydrolase [Pseudomonadota bacterium]